MEKKLRIGVIGTGTFSLYHLDAITNNKRAFRDMAEVRSVIRKTARNYAYKRIKHSPMIIPIITEI